jgi:magnesium chelatase family protein
MSRVGKYELMGTDVAETSAEVRERVMAARRRQSDRWGSPLRTNASVPKSQLDGAVGLSMGARAQLEEMIDRLTLSGRGVGRILRIARTLADLDDRDDVADHDVAEAIDWRMFDDPAEVVSR